MNALHRTWFSVLTLIAVLGGIVPPAPAVAQSTQLPAHATVPTPVPSPQLPVTPSVAPGYEAPNVEPTSANIIGVTQQPFVGIGLSDAIGMALLRNPNLAVSASQVKIARYQIVEAKGAFDVRLQVEPSSSMVITPPESFFAAGPNYSDIIQHQSSFQYGVGGQTVNGTQYTVGIQQSRTFNNNYVNAFNPYYLASLNIAVTQPLLRNFGMNASKRQLKLAMANSDVNAAQAQVDASNTIAQVSDAYWSLVAAWRNVAIQEEALKDAIAQQQSNVRLASKGAAAPIDAVESSTQVSNFQDNVFSALQSVSELQNTLKGLVITDPGDPIWRANLVPTSSVLELPNVPGLETIIAEGMKNRPEVREALAKHAEAEIDLGFAKNQSLPQADLQVTYQSNGFAGLLAPVPAFENNQCISTTLEDCPPPPGKTQGTMAYAYHNLWNFSYPTFNIGVLVSQPLGNNYAKGLKGVAKQEQHEADVLTEGVAARIGFEARNALQSYQSALSRLWASRQARSAAEQVYASELRKFHNGASTTFLVLQRQVELNQNRLRELQAQTDLNKSVVELTRVEGTILSENGVDLQTMGSKAIPGGTK
ncbi:MAG TPA: TolC family protein [Candidatus Acidoferrales bacterium]|nr:TolC family protein [Candidatus Acidoferrales bacterium]